MRHKFHPLWIGLTLFLATPFLNAESETPPAEMDTAKCNQANSELKTHFEKNTSKNLPANWTVISEVETDFDGDKQKDQAILVNRKFPVSPNNEKTFAPNVNYLVVILSNNGKPKAIFPKAPTSPVPDDFSMNDTEIKLKDKVIEVQEKTARSMGSWSAETATYKWRYQSGDFRLIGYTYSSQHRAKPFPEKTLDRNLITGKEQRYDSMPLKDYFYESGEFKPSKSAGQKELTEDEQNKQVDAQLKPYKTKITKEKNKSILKSQETQEEWIKIKTETTETANSPVLLSQFGSCEFSLETAY